ncbi:Ppx/GppA phosphatase family protein [Sulfurimonas sp.]|uniref:Ppx/GppA phosphatase family protein n=1 Tax=Sulfurimonas sp. TaxID=2022749 RepID=UPI003564A50D
MAKRVAVIDIGSNSVRMVIYEKTSRFAFHLLYESKSKVRLSENAYNNNGNLQQNAMDRAYHALSDFVNIISSFKARKTLCVATSALRDAPNKLDFLKRVRNGLKLNIKIIDGEREAYLGGIACANLLPTQENALTVDIGGGSTEFAYINNKNVKETISLDLGTVRLKEMFFDTEDIEGAKKYIDEKLSVLDNINTSKLIGIGGTFRAIITSIMKQNKFPLRKLHAYECDIDSFKSFIKNVLDSQTESDLKCLYIKENRFDIIKPGSLILHRVIKKLNISELITSGVGVREGVYLSDLLRTSNDRLPVNYNTSVRHILDSHVSDKEYSNNLNKLSKQLFDLLKDKFELDENYRSDLAIAAKLYPSGGSIHQFAQNRHSYYLLQSSLEYGFTQKQMVLISTLVRYAKRRLPSSTHVEKYKVLLPDVRTLNTLSYILTLSIYLLNHRPRNIDFTCSLKDNRLIIDSKDELYLTKEDMTSLKPLEDLEIVFS